MRAVVRYGIGGFLVLLLALGGFSSLGGCFAEQGVPSGGAAPATAARSEGLADGPPGDAPLANRLLSQSSPAIQDRDDLDPFGSLPIGIGFDTYTTECDPIADPYATCL